MDRRCGVLLPVASLPSRYGIGCFSKEAYEFVDFLADSGQSYWQILPLGQTGYGDSPYQSFSTFAGNPYFIDPEALIEAGFAGRTRTAPSVRTLRGSGRRMLMKATGEPSRISDGTTRNGFRITRCSAR